MRRGLWRTVRWPLLLWCCLAFVIWSAFFDLLISRGQKQYFLLQARHELGLVPAPTIDEVMSRTIADARRIATVWSLIVFAAGAGSTWFVASRRLQP